MATTKAPIASTTIADPKSSVLSIPNTSINTNPNTAVTTKAIRRIALHPTLTPYRRRVYRTLLSIPPGRWTSYAVLAKHLGSSARAVGGAMRGNPFAPEVPCHRVLGSGGLVGGYKGVWNKAGSQSRSRSRSGDADTDADADGVGITTGDEKRKLLEMEGVVFDDAGRAKGECFEAFCDLGQTSSAVVR